MEKSGQRDGPGVSKSLSRLISIEAGASGIAVICASLLIRKACLMAGIHWDGVVLHADNGGPMKGATMVLKDVVHSKIIGGSVGGLNQATCLFSALPNQFTLVYHPNRRAA